MAEWLYTHLVPLLVVIVAVIYITAWRTLAPRKSLNDAGVKFGPETDISGYAESAGPCFWRDAQDGTPINYGGFPGTAAVDIYACTGLHDKEFVIPHRDPWQYDRVPTVAEHDAANLDIESVDTFVSYSELMGRLRSGVMLPKDMPPTLPVTFEMLLSMVMAMIDTNERKGNAQTCDRVFTLLRRRYDATSLNGVPEQRYLELWVDLKGLERLRG